jgi:hypothetical protein
VILNGYTAMGDRGAVLVTNVVVLARETAVAVEADSYVELGGEFGWRVQV